MDAAITYYAISNQEVREFGALSLVNPEADVNQLVLAKMAMITAWLGVCAVLAAKNDRQKSNRLWDKDLRGQFIAEAGLAGGNIFIWGVVTWNLANLAINRMAGQ